MFQLPINGIMIKIIALEKANHVCLKTGGTLEKSNNANLFFLKISCLLKFPKSLSKMPGVLMSVWIKEPVDPMDHKSQKRTQLKLKLWDCFPETKEPTFDGCL